MTPHDNEDARVRDWLTATHADDYGPAWHEMTEPEKDYRRAMYLANRDYFEEESK